MLTTIKRVAVVAVIGSAGLLAGASAASADVVKINPAYAPGTSSGSASENRCVGYEGDHAYITVNYPSGDPALFVGQLYVNNVAGCLG